MKTRKMKSAPLALAVAALFAAPLAFSQEGTQDSKTTSATSVSTDTSSTENSTSVNIEKDLRYRQDVHVKGHVYVNGSISVDSSSAALVDDKQINYLNQVNNDEVTNSSVVNGNALQNAAGNIGLNVTAGDNNQQANSAALAASDASFLFGSSDAEIFARQDVQANRAVNYGSTNTASLAGNALQNATGNIGVNISAGSSNQQKNDLAASVAVARMATATVAVKQMNDHNVTSNTPKRQEVVTMAPVDLAFQSRGIYAGISDQKGNQYPDSWTGSSHPGGTQTGHFDLDTNTQGGLDRQASSGLNAGGAPNGDSSAGGSLSFNEQGDIALSGSVTGMLPVVTHVSIATTNTSSLGGNALMGAAGNIGVNIASGNNNQQYNGMAVSATQAGSGNGGGGETLRR
ncbi:hypothetical protein [Polaromonas sp.]|jgi:hypothetical protein|uniref:hypothetical protein n=1 Tax=Polaromonas sp. TaxID=1869339 RepID=UPI0037C8F271